ILPFLEQDNAFKLFDLTKPYANQIPQAQQTQIKTYFCPSRRGPGQLSVSEDIYGNSQGDPAMAPGPVGDYGACVGTTVTPDPVTHLNQWPFEKAHGAIIDARNLPLGQSNTSLPSITDGTSNTLMVGEKHLPVGRFGRGPYGDGSIYNAYAVLYSAR